MRYSQVLAVFSPHKPSDPIFVPPVRSTAWPLRDLTVSGNLMISARHSFRRLALKFVSQEAMNSVEGLARRSTARSKGLAAPSTPMQR